MNIYFLELPKRNLTFDFIIKMMNLNETLVMPLESAEFIMKNSKSVNIVNTGIENLSNKVTF